MIFMGLLRQGRENLESKSLLFVLSGWSQQCAVPVAFSDQTDPRLQRQAKRSSMMPRAGVAYNFLLHFHYE